MNKILSIILIICFFSTANAQIAIHGAYSNINSEQYDSRGLYKDDIVKNGYKLGLNYWFRLKNYRIEFIPELSYTQFKKENTTKLYSDQLNISQFSVPVLIYPFDIKGDCHCPTFSKQDNFLKKGFYLEVMPLVNYQNNIFETQPLQVVNGSNELKKNSIGYGGSLGFGIDFGLAARVTLTPYARFGWIKGSEFYTAESIFEVVNSTQIFTDSNVIQYDEDTQKQTEFGLRLMMRFDEPKPKYKKRRRK